MDRILGAPLSRPLPTRVAVLYNTTTKPQGACILHDTPPFPRQHCYQTSSHHPLRIFSGVVFVYTASLGDSTKMVLLHLPAEVLLQVATFLKTKRDINSLSQANRHFHSLLSPYLYRLDARGSNTALLWGSQHGNEDTVRICLQTGGQD